ncbi:hypothetical protein AVMA1855_16810 [Acidovorax sp. SUPP1855]|uniref:HNH endonuclease n=1 Tax=Acidovorax sp. SUPP1855 TaxID=431774 RepID=UPI0023DE5AEC|nr:HNH endonuclease [Acidovorax sp. SUPP1855]GKS85836.1 hypothetical protein AVMA1855_16810 [Acidovorax sp. SUPP1855]
MATLEQLHARCIEDGDCLLWQGGLSKSAGHPKFNNRSARRLVYELAHGPIPAGRNITVTCDCISCLNPEHLALTTKAEASRKANACPSVRAKKSVASAKASRPKGKLTIEIAREIRASTGTCDELAAVYSVDRTLISKVRRGSAWRELVASPFQGLFL